MSDPQLAPHTRHTCRSCGKPVDVLEAPDLHVDPAGFECIPCQHQRQDRLENIRAGRPVQIPAGEFPPGY